MATRNNMTCSVTKTSKWIGYSLVVAVALCFTGIATAGETKTAKTDAALKTLPTDSDAVHARLTSRYSDPKNIRVINDLTTERALELYMEVQGMIDARHVSPASYDARVKRAANNLLVAVENPAFLEVNGINPSTENVATVKWALNALIEGAPVKTANDSLAALRWVSNMMSTHMKVRPSTVAFEFINGSLESLDKYSAFLSPTKTGGPSVGLDDHVVGIGVEVDSHDLGARVVKVLSEGPASEAGLKKGDIIVSVNGRSLKGNSLNEIVELITGKSGTRLTLGISRDESPMSLTMVRRSVALKSVSEVSMIGETGNVGYIKLDHFSQSSTEEMEKALNMLHSKGMESLIVDLRGNPGGLLTTAIELSDLFLPKGTIVSTRGRNSVDNMLEVAKFEHTWRVPMVVLIDENSASASEIFAAAIQENRRGVIVGRNSYGKGTVQTHFGTRTVSATLKLTTAKFYSPNGREMAGAGVAPDVQVAANNNTNSGLDRDLEAALSATKGETAKNLANSVNRLQTEKNPG